MPDDKTQTNQSGSNGGSQSPANGQGQNGESSHTPTRPEPLADAQFDSYWDDKAGIKYDALAKDFTSLRTYKAEQDVRAASLPAQPTDYKLELPGGFQMPEGITGWEWNEKDPRLEEVRKYAHENHLDQGAFSRLLGIHVAHELRDMQTVKAARDAEIQKLGANGPARVTALGTLLTTHLGKDKGEALLDRLVFKEDVEAMEDLVKKLTGNVVAFDQRHRTGADPKPPTAEDVLFPTMTKQQQR